MNQIILIGLGIVLGFAICMGITLFTNDQADSPTLADLPETPKVGKKIAPEPHYDHEDEGKVIFKLETLKDERFQSSEGSDATLFQRPEYCKLRIRIMGGSGFSHLSYFFKQEKLLYALQSTYYYPFGGLSNLQNPEALTPELYANEIFNPHSERVVAEFESVLAEFPSQKIQQCFHAST